MTQRQRLRRTAFTCTYALANMACYRAGFKSRVFVRNENFWRRLNGNFVELGVLDWCKVFADRKAKHYAWKVVSDPAQSTIGLLAQLNMTQADFDTYATSMKHLHDKFIAHLDDDLTAPLPRLDPTIDSAKFTLEYLIANENSLNYLEALPRRGGTVWRLAYEEARQHYGNT